MKVDAKRRTEWVTTIELNDKERNLLAYILAEPVGKFLRNHHEDFARILCTGLSMTPDDEEGGS